MHQLRWSYGVHLLAQSDEQVSGVDLTESEATVVPGSDGASSSPNLSPPFLSPSNLRSRTSNGGMTRFSFTRVWHGLHAFGRGFVQFMTMPLFAALASIIVAITPPLQHFLDERVHPVKAFLTAAGNCSIPVTLIILGAYFYQEPQGADERGHDKTVKPGVIGRAIAFRRRIRSPSLPPINLEEVEQRGDWDQSLLDLSGDAEAQSLPDPGTSWRAAEDTQFLLSNSSPLPPISASGFHRRGIRSSWVNFSALAANVRGAFTRRDASSRPTSVGAENNRGSLLQGGEREFPLGETKTVLAALISRMIFVPIVMLPLLSVLAYFNLHPVFDE